MTYTDAQLGELPAARYERKFIASDFAIEEVLSRVQMHPAGFTQPYPPRWVNSIYLDTPNLRHYYVHINGVPNRYKVRVRWYGDMSGEVTDPRLEFKIRRGFVGGKIVYPLHPIQIDLENPANSLERSLAASELNEATEDYLKMLTPTLLNRYWRHYFLSNDGRYRLTLDADLEFYDPTRPCTREFNLNRETTPPIILELKYLPEHSAGAQAITNKLPYRLTRCSKYILGIEKEFGNVS